MDKPKKPASGFLRFLKESYANSAKENRGEYREFHKMIVQNWHEMPEGKKNTYNDACKAETVNYRQELAKWELKMVRLGNVDLVRQEALIEQETKSPRGKGRSKVQKSDWELGWCLESPIDITQQTVISSKHPKLSSHLPTTPQKTDDEHLKINHHEELEMKSTAPSKSKGESDTTSDNLQQPILSSTTIQPTEPEAVPSKTEQPNENSKGTVMNKFKDFFKF